MTSQQKTSAIEEGIRPAAALAIGSASMPPPIDAPMISRTPPINLDVMQVPYLVFMASGIGGGSFPVHH